MKIEHANKTVMTRDKASACRRRLRSTRMLVLAASGGCLLQAAGCAFGVAPVLVSFAESAWASLLFSSFFGG